MIKKLFYGVLSLALLSFSGASISSEYQHQKEFTNHVSMYEKVYSVEELFSRYNTFKSNIDIIKSHNENNVSFTLAMNQFGDLTPEEFKKEVVGSCFAGGVNTNVVIDSTNIKLPSPIDWRSKGAVTPVKNQGYCHSCWAFSATGAIEGRTYIAKGTLPNLSEQQLVDCSGSFGNSDCKGGGGLMNNAFKYATKYGLCHSSVYPYTGRDQPCRSCHIEVQTKGYRDVPSGDEETLGDALSMGPVSVAVQAEQDIFQFYHDGIIDGVCKKNLDHGVLAVGFNTDSANSGYWIVKNSWGTSWGKQGYVQIRAFKNMCGIALAASYPIV
jgi:cathepsin L